ncbi:hypothetical protein Celaphus_00002906 [Cervus elaphus hippelaphus]|uniref:Multiple myeloma tumor-associated protein 2-like N-terminal domain-containing protein n=1 Tax=Cervus elaphus hippelaphus TaxID=46360 RepID=A0A212D2A2_CEREH|nr:hypothetical protein Celaphus_00002906 [Cervus elaphus hippelaphus]
MFGSSRGGVRGGQDQFSWEDVKTDKQRENYLGEWGAGTRSSRAHHRVESSRPGTSLALAKKKPRSEEKVEPGPESHRKSRKEKKKKRHKKEKRKKEKERGRRLDSSLPPAPVQRDSDSSTCCKKRRHDSD